MTALGRLLNISAVFLLGLLILALSSDSEWACKAGMTLMVIGVFIFIVNIPHLKSPLKGQEDKK